MDALVTLANVLNVAGFFVKDRLWVRALSLTATSCLAFYFRSHPEPFAHAMYWNLLFLTLHAVMLARLLLERAKGGYSAS